jgi:hypothetical protein
LQRGKHLYFPSALFIFHHPILSFAAICYRRLYVAVNREKQVSGEKDTNKHKRLAAVDKSTGKQPIILFRSRHTNKLFLIFKKL